MFIFIIENTAWLIGLFLLVDLLAGVFHWAEDTLGNVDTPIWGPFFVAPNVIHHNAPPRDE